MTRHKITVSKDDQCITDIIINTRQPEGWFEYIPKAGDKFRVVVKNRRNDIVRETVTTVQDGNAERISLTIPTDLDGGKYTYDVMLILTEEEKETTHTICDENILIIKEDDAYA